MDLGRFLGRGKKDGVAVHVEHRADLQPGRRHHLVADEEAPGVVVVHGPHQGPVVSEPWRPGHDVEKAGVEVLTAEPGRAGGGVHIKDLHAALVPALDHDDQGGPGPADGNQVFERRAVPVDRQPGSVQTRQPQRHIGVGRPRGWIGDLPCRPVRVRRIGDIPASDRSDVDAGDEQGVPAR